jgi:hypothetical protein
MNEIGAFMKSMRRQLCSRKQGPAYCWFLVRVLLRYPHMLANAVRLAIMGYHFEKITQHQVAMDDFKQYLAAELETFQHTVTRFVQTQSHRMGEMGDCVQDLLAQVRTQYDAIHAECRDGVQEALEGFQHSVFTHYLEAELHVFQAAIARWAHAHSDRVGAANVYVHHLFARVQVHYERMHQDCQYNAQDALNAFRLSVKRHLEQCFGPIHPQIEGLD